MWSICFTAWRLLSAKFYLSKNKGTSLLQLHRCSSRTLVEILILVNFAGNKVGILFLSILRMASPMEKETNNDEIVSVELPAPPSWKKMVLFLNFTCSHHVFFFFSFTLLALLFYLSTVNLLKKFL